MNDEEEMEGSPIKKAKYDDSDVSFQIANFCLSNALCIIV